MTRSTAALDLERELLSQLVAPADPTEFIAKTRERDVLFLDSAAQPRIDVDLQRLDQALATIRVTPGRVRVVNDGRSVPDLALIEPVSPGDVARGDRAAFTRLNPTALAAALAGGGTLIVNSVDELLPAVDVALRCLERALGSYQGFANLYASWGMARGFDLHVDDHDTCIVQVSGAKEWYLFSRSADLAALQGQPLEAIRSSGHLEHVVRMREGCLLYVPRGVPHLAQPIEDHSMHVTLGYRRPTVADFLQWVLTQPEALSTGAALVHVDAPPDAISRMLPAMLGLQERDLVPRFLAAVAEPSRGRPAIRIFAP